MKNPTIISPQVLIIAILYELNNLYQVVINFCPLYGVIQNVAVLSHSYIISITHTFASKTLLNSDRKSA